MFRPILLFAWVPFLISLAVSAAVSAGSYVIQRLLRPTINRGKLGGDLQIQDSAYGSFIPEIYGGITDDTPASWPTWGTPTNCTIGSQNNPIKTGGSDGSFDAKVESLNTFQYDNAGSINLPYNLRFTSRKDGGFGCGFVPTSFTSSTSGAGFAFGIIVDTDGKIQGWGDGTKRYESAAGAFILGDALRIEVELQSIRYYHKNNLLAEYAQNAFSADPGPYKIRAILKNDDARVDDVQFWRYTGTRAYDAATTAPTMAGLVNATIDAATNAIQKTGGTPGTFDAGGRSIEINAGSSGNGMIASWKVDQLGDWAVGFAGTDPAGDWNLINLVVKGNASGNISLYKRVSGSQALLDSTGSYGPGDTIELRHTPGSAIIFPMNFGGLSVSVNGTTVLSGSSGPEYDSNDTFYLATAIATANLKITDLKFAPLTEQPLSAPVLMGKESGVKIAGNVIWASDIRKHTTKKKVGGKGGGQKVREFSYDVDLAVMIGRGPLKVVKIWAGSDLMYDIAKNGSAPGVYDAETGMQTSYTLQLTSVITAMSDIRAFTQRVSSSYYGEQTADANGVITVTAAKTGATVRIYPGNETQTVDPLIQADVDGREGSGSTPAYRGRCYVVFEQFYFKRSNVQKDGSDAGYDYGGIPNFRFLVYNTANQTLDEICVDLCSRAGLPSGAYDFTALSAIQSRGLLIGQRQAPRQAMEDLSDAYAVDFVEDEAQIIGFERGQASVAAIEDYELGWASGDDTNAIPVKLQHKLTDEIQIPSRVDVRFIDPAMDFDNGSAGASRQTVSSSRVATIDLSITLSQSEALEIANRKLYESWLERRQAAMEIGPKYSWLRPGDVVVINEEETTIGATSPVTLSHRLRVTERSGEGGGLQKLALIPEEQYIYDDAATVSAAVVVSSGSASAPSPTLATIIDVVPLRDNDDKPGFYVAMGPANSSLSWTGATLYQVAADGSLTEIVGAGKAATMGVCVNTLPVAQSQTWDESSYLIVDLTSGELASITEAEAYEGIENVALVGDEIIIFQNAALMDGYTNRYRLWRLLRSRKGTDDGVWTSNGTKAPTHAANERFVLLDDALQFVELDLSARGIERTYKAITGGQQESSAPSGTATYAANNLKPLAPVDIEGTRDGSQNLTITWTRRARINGGLVDFVDAPLDEPTEAYEVDVLNGSTVLRTITATAATASYSAANQTTDFGSAQSSVKVRVYQISSRVRRGKPGEALV